MIDMPKEDFKPYGNKPNKAAIRQAEADAHPPRKARRNRSCKSSKGEHERFGDPRTSPHLIYRDILCRCGKMLWTEYVCSRCGTWHEGKDSFEKAWECRKTCVKAE